MTAPAENSPTLRRAVFWDRDGTLMQEVHYCADPALVRAIPGAAAALADLRAAGWLNLIITNQSGIGRGLFTPTQYEAVTDELLRQLGRTIDAVYFCPDPPDRPSSRRKPATGMLAEAARDHRIDLARSWFVGDKDVDIQCGRAAGCRTILVQTGYGQSHAKADPDFCVADAAAAAEIIRSARP